MRTRSLIRNSVIAAGLMVASQLFRLAKSWPRIQRLPTRPFLKRQLMA